MRSASFSLQAAINNFKAAQQLETKKHQGKPQADQQQQIIDNAIAQAAKNKPANLKQTGTSSFLSGLMDKAKSVAKGVGSLGSLGSKAVSTFDSIGSKMKDSVGKLIPEYENNLDDIVKYGVLKYAQANDIKNLPIREGLSLSKGDLSSQLTVKGTNISKLTNNKKLKEALVFCLNQNDKGLIQCNTNIYKWMTVYMMYHTMQKNEPAPQAATQNGGVQVTGAQATPAQVAKAPAIQAQAAKAQAAKAPAIQAQAAKAQAAKAQAASTQVAPATQVAKAPINATNNDIFENMFRPSKDNNKPFVEFCTQEKYYEIIVNVEEGKNLLKKLKETSYTKPFLLNTTTTEPNIKATFWPQSIQRTKSKNTAAIGGANTNSTNGAVKPNTTTNGENSGAKPKTTASNAKPNTNAANGAAKPNTNGANGAKTKNGFLDKFKSKPKDCKSFDQSESDKISILKAYILQILQSINACIDVEKNQCKTDFNANKKDQSQKEKADKNAVKAKEKAEKDAVKAKEKADKNAVKAKEKAEKNAVKAKEKAEKEAAKAQKAAAKGGKRGRKNSRRNTKKSQ